MSKWGFSKERYKKLMKLWEGDYFLTYSEPDSGYKSLAKVNSEMERYEILTERYDYACDVLKKRCLNKGIRIPKRLKIINEKYLSRESNDSIGETYNNLKKLLYDRSIKDKQKKDDALTKYIDPITKKEKKKIREFKKSKKLDNIIKMLRNNSIKWKCFEKSDSWFILQEPKSSRRVRIQVDIFGRIPCSIPVTKILVELKKLFFKWNAPSKSFKSGSFREGTLTNCGWHAYLSKPDRKEALKLCVSIWGGNHIRDALISTKKLPSVSGYEKQIEEDVQYVSKSFKTMQRIKRNFNNIIIVKMI